MDLTTYVETLQNDLALAAAAGGPDAEALADRLTAPLEAATRLAMLDALSAAAAEITRDLAPGSVDLRLRGREVSFVVTRPPDEAEPGESAPLLNEVASRAALEGDESSMARINLRLGEDLKARVEEAARSAGLSVNAWLVRAAAAAVAGDEGRGRTTRRAPRGGDQFTGWVS